MEKEIMEKLKLKIAIYEMKEEARVSKIKKRKLINKKLGIAACACVILTSGIVFAKDIEKFIKDKIHLGKGVETAIENGYIVKPDDEYTFCNVKVINKEGKEVEDIKLGVKVDSYLIDNSNLNIEIKFKYDECLNDIVNINNLHTIMLEDLIIIDDEKRVLYDGGVGNKEIFEKYCKENNLNYTFGNCNENYLNSGLNTFESPETCLKNEKSYIYNFYVEDENYPKSKKINLIFTQISFNEFSDENVIVNGNWNIELDIPEKMYNNVEGNYSVIKCENDKFDVYAAKLTETGFELGLKINGLENPEYSVELAEEERRFHESISVGQEYGSGLRITDESKTKFYKESPYIELYENYYTKHFPTSIKAVRLYMPWVEETEGCYIQTSDGNKFYISESGCANQRNSFNEDNTYEFYNKFDMTKYDATDYISAVIELYGSPVKIFLKRTN
ncbi:MAG: DUF4179 domain-containing protein [Clostridia bacterium]|nr:DUF4179 domain-containing protein [Clostridia bacterium]